MRRAAPLAVLSLALALFGAGCTEDPRPQMPVGAAMPEIRASAEMFPSSANVNVQAVVK